MYGQALTHAFVYDDGLVITGNAFIRDIANLKHLFTPAYFSGSGELSWRPLATFGYFVDYALFGLQAWWYHAHNLVLHLAVAFAFLWLLARLGVQDWPAWIAVGLFLVHPVGVETVACPANREELYCALFLIMALGCAASWRPPLAVSGFFVLTLLSKETAAVLPLLVLGLWIFRRRAKTAGLLEPPRNDSELRQISAVLLVLALYGIFRFVLLQNNLERGLDYRGGTLWSSVALHAGGWWEMLRLFVCPTDLNVEHSIIYAPGWAGGFALMTYALIAGLLAAAWVIARKSVCAALGIWWMVCSFLPVAGFVPIANVFAERFLYIPLIGFAIAIAGMGDWLRKKVGVVGVVAALSFVSVLGWMTFERVGVWRSNESLWADSVAKNPDSSRARNNLGDALFKKGLVQAAQGEFEAAAALDPQSADIWRNLASCYEAQAQWDRAQECLVTALQLEPNNPHAHLSYADVLYKAGKIEPAQEQYRAAIRIKPDFPEAVNNLGVLLMHNGRPGEATEQFQKALELVGEYPDALCNLGSLAAQQGDRTRAKEFWKKALKINPYHAESQKNLRSAMTREPQ